MGSPQHRNLPRQQSILFHYLKFIHTHTEQQGTRPTLQSCAIRLQFFLPAGSKCSATPGVIICVFVCEVKQQLHLSPEIKHIHTSPTRENMDDEKHVRCVHHPRSCSSYKHNTCFCTDYTKETWHVSCELRPLLSVFVLSKTKQLLVPYRNKTGIGLLI